MSANTKASLEEIIISLWSSVIETVNKVLEADGKFGFNKIEASLNPSIEEILHGLGMIEAVLSVFVESPLLEHDETRRALNAKQCVLHIRRIAVALEGGNEAEYKEAIELLSNQAQC